MKVVEFLSHLNSLDIKIWLDNDKPLLVSEIELSVFFREQK